MRIQILIITLFIQKIFTFTFDEEIITFKENWISFKNFNHEISATGGGNNEFQQYFLDPETSRLVNNTLQIYPRFIEADLRDDLDLYQKGCTNNWNNGCFSKGSMHWQHGSIHYENNIPIPVGGLRSKPFKSAKLISKESFGYGKLTINFKLPKGNFLWPAIWMLPTTNYIWPIGGEIDIIESMGNSPNSGYGLNYNSVSSALHFGYNKSLYPIAFTPFAEKVQKISYDRKNLKEWNKVSLYRSKYNIIITLNGNEIFNCDKMFKAAAQQLPDNTIFKKEIIDKGYLAGFRKYSIMMGENLPDFLWKDLPYDAPFHENFNLIINTAIGGNFFGDSMNSDKNLVKPPWNDISKGKLPSVQFLERIEEWFNWSDEKPIFEKNNIETLDWKSCIKDSVPCDANKKLYLDSEKHLSFKKPKIGDKTAFHIGKITFEPY